MTNIFIQELAERAQFAVDAGAGRWRMGQSLMNVLVDLDLDLYRKISDMPAVDPFFDDAKIPAFIAYLHIDEIIWVLADRYSFLSRFDEDAHRFVIESNVDGLHNNFFWASDQTLVDFFKTLADYLELIGQ